MLDYYNELQYLLSIKNKFYIIKIFRYIIWLEEELDIDAEELAVGALVIEEDKFISFSLGIMK